MATGTDSKIDTRLFLATAETTAKVAKDLETCFQDWAKVMQSLRGNWQGDTSDNIKNTVEAVQRSASDLLRAINGYGSALKEMAGIYDKTEKAVQESSRTLKFDKALR